jgi:hypothetical protein
MANIQHMLAWVSKVLFGRPTRGRRRRELQFLLLAIIIGVIVCAVIAGVLYVLNCQLPK